MTLTIEQIYLRFSIREFCRKIEIKRRNTNGTYEAEWQDVEELSGLKLLNKSVKSISYKAPNDSYNFGIITVGNCTISLNSKNGQFDDESNSSSVFKDFVRHKSLLRVRDGYVDNFTDESNPVAVYETVFEGFIDENNTSTTVDDENLIQNFVCIDLLSFLLKEFTISDMGALTSTDLDDLILEILDRPEFTDFFSVNISNIVPGYNIASFDISEYEGQTLLYSLFQEFSIGHSFFYVKNNTFFYLGIDSGNTSTFSIDEKKLIKFSGYKSGVSVMIERLNWEDTPAITFTATPNIYNRGKTINIKGATVAQERQNLLNTIGNLTKLKKKQFKIDIPYFMAVFIMDEILISSPVIIPLNAFVWSVSRWGGAVWSKSLQADNIPNNQTWLVKEVKHSKLKTKLTLQEII